MRLLWPEVGGPPCVDYENENKETKGVGGMRKLSFGGGGLCHHQEASFTGEGR